MGLRIKVTHDGLKNASVQITGSGAFDWTNAVFPTDLTPSPKHFKIDAVYYSISDGVELQLAWKAEKDHHPVLALGGRGKLDFAEVGGCHTTANGETVGIEFRTLNAKSKDQIFTLILDLSKHVGER